MLYKMRKSTLQNEQSEDRDIVEDLIRTILT